MTLLLIRHGETALGAAHVIQRADTPLPERGVVQADRLPPRLAALGVSLILSSELRPAGLAGARPGSGAGGASGSRVAGGGTRPASTAANQSMVTRRAAAATSAGGSASASGVA